MTNRREFLGAGIAACCVPSALLAEVQRLDVAYLNGRIWTGVAGEPLASAIGTAGATIAAVGEGPVRKLTDRTTRIVDLDGAFVTPGFIDSHTHFLNAAETLRPPHLKNARTREEFVAAIAKAARELEPGEWMQGGNWDNELWGGELPTREWIDAVTPATPVAIARYDLHMLLVNSLALRIAGIDRGTPDPDGGRILRTANGEPTGIVVDRAKPLVESHIPAPSDAAREKTLRTGIRLGLEHGVTQTHVMGLDWVMHEALLRLRARGETDLRFYSFVPLEDWRKLADVVERDGRGDEWLRWGGLKGFADGSLGSRTALFHQPYDDDPDTRGLTVTPVEKLLEWTAQADRRGLQVSIHAIGDAANDSVLDVMARVAATNGPRDRRFRIEHAQHLTQAAIPRFGRQHVIASVQPYHAIDDGRWAVNRIGPERLKGTYAFKSLLDTGARLAFGSDWPVAPLDPLTGIAAAVLRRTLDGKHPEGWYPQQRLTVEQALTAYTAANAFAGFQEDRLGQLRPGCLADCVVLDQNLLEIPPERITASKVLRTVVGGRERYTR
jgi:predicted amidohydrolase YtcJ